MYCIKGYKINFRDVIPASLLAPPSCPMLKILNNVGVQYFETGEFIKDVTPQHKDEFFHQLPDRIKI